MIVHNRQISNNIKFTCERCSVKVLEVEISSSAYLQFVK